MVLPQPWGTRRFAVVRMTDTTGWQTNHLVASQVHKHMMGEASPSVQLSDKTFRCALSTRKVSKATDRQLMARLRELGAAAPQANNVVLAPVRSIIKALSKLHFPKDVVMCFAAIESRLPPPPPVAPGNHPPMPSSSAPPPPPAPPHPAPSTPPPPFSATPPPPPMQPTATTPQPPEPLAFPSTLPPPPALLDHQRREHYNLMSLLPSNSCMPSTLAGELDIFETWSRSPIQLDRDSKYKACQEVTVETTRELITSYMGFLFKHQATSLHHLSLYLYRSPNLVAAFVAYLLARRVGRGQISKHITTAKKVCSFLNSQHPWAAQKPMEDWLTRLDNQVPTLIPKLPPPPLPPIALVFDWVDRLVDTSLESYKADLLRWVAWNLRVVLPCCILLETVHACMHGWVAE